MTRSAQAFEKVVFPAISSLIGGGSIEMVEGTGGFNQTIDMACGIDAWQYIEGRGVRGIASRVQWVDTPYLTFTIRSARPNGSRTELVKRTSDDSERGFIGPHLTVQSYLSMSGDLLAAGCCVTTVLYRFASEHPSLVQTRTNRSDGVEFVFVPWKAMGKRVKVWNPGGACPDCFGNGSGCTTCAGTGYVTEARW